MSTTQRRSATASIATVATSAAVLVGLIGASAITPVLAPTAAAAMIAGQVRAIGLAAATDREPLPSMPLVDARDYRDEAAALPAELVQALARDTGQTGAEYLAQAQAASAAAVIVDALAERYDGIVDSYLDGTTLVVIASDPATAAAASAAGARVELGEPRPPADPVTVYPMADLRGGEPYLYTVGSSLYRCTTGFAGRDSSGSPRILTAGHCSGADTGTRNHLTFRYPNDTQRVQTSIGPGVSGSFRFGGGYDHGLLSVTNTAAWQLVPQVSTWGYGASAPGTSPLTVRDAMPPIAGATVCKSGSTSGWTCGPVTAAVALAQFSPTVQATGMFARLCMLGGDSGGAALIGTAAVGINSGSTAADGPCTSTSEGFFTHVHGSASYTAQSLYGSGFEPAIAVATPTVAQRSAVFSGTLAHGGPRHRVVVTVQGYPAVVTPVLPDGSWSATIAASMPAGLPYTVQARWGTHNVSTVASGTTTATSAPTPSPTPTPTPSPTPTASPSPSPSAPPSGITADRLSGADRYATAVTVSQRAFPGTVTTVVLASGENYPDALSAGPAAAELGGPLLLTRAGSLPTSVQVELQRLRPSRVIIVGGPGVIAPAVVTDLEQRFGVSTTRIGGIDRYQTSRWVAWWTWYWSGASTAYVATGAGYADALSAGAAAASERMPLLLVPGGATTLPRETRDILTDTLQVEQLFIAGGTGAVGSAMHQTLSSIAPATRLPGVDRFATSTAINDRAHDTATEAYLAYGYNYPDALAGGVLAGLRAAPLYVTRGTCVPSGVLDHLTGLGVRTVTLLGGTGALSQQVAQLRRC